MPKGCDFWMVCVNLGVQIRKGDYITVDILVAVGQGTGGIIYWSQILTSDSNTV